MKSSESNIRLLEGQEQYEAELISLNRIAPAVVGHCRGATGDKWGVARLGKTLAFRGANVRFPENVDLGLSEIMIQKWKPTLAL